MSVGALVIGIVFILVGLSQLLFPLKLREYDWRLTLFIKDRDEARAAVMVFGVIFILMGVFVVTIVISGLGETTK